MRVGAVVLLGFALRLLRLAQLGDLEFDEIVSVRYASLPLPELLPRLAGALFEHPPAFYALLGAWRALIGDADVLARLCSVLPGTLSIPLAYAVGRRAFGPGAGLLGSLLVAVGPLTLFYSREARMYGLVTCLGLATLWLLLRQLDRPRGPGWWLAYVALGALTAYVHYLGALLVLSHVAAAWLLRHRAPHALRPVALASAVIVALALPWAAAAGGGRASLPALAAANLVAAPGAAVTLLADLAAGPEAGAGAAALAGLALVTLAAFGLPRRDAPRIAFVAAYVAGAVGLLFALALGKPVQARYVLPVVPLVYLCAANTVVRLRYVDPLVDAAAVAGDEPPRYSRMRGAALQIGAARRLAALGCVVSGLAALLGAASFWWGYYGSYERADYSAVTARIAGLERPGDGVLLTGPWQAWYFDYYYPRSGGALSHQVLPQDAPPALDPTQARPALEDLAGAHRRLWFVQAGLAQADPTNFVERWLQARAWPALREAHENAVLSLYVLDEPAQRRPLAPATFGSRVRLSGGWVEAGDVPAGDVARLSFEFESLGAAGGVGEAGGDLNASLRLVGADGQRTAMDFPLVDRREEEELPASRWPAGSRVVVRRGILVPPSLGPQPYEVRLVVYDPVSLQPLPLVPAGGDAANGVPPVGAPGGEAPIGYVVVTQSLAGREPAGIPAAGGAGARFGGGDDFDTIAFRGARWGQENPSAAPLSVDLLWQLVGFTGSDHLSTLAVVDERGRTWAEESRPLFGGTFNIHDWRDGETVAERRSLDLTGLPAGRYRVLLGLEDGRGRALPVDGHQGQLNLATFSLPYRRPLGERLTGLLSRLHFWGR